MSYQELDLCILKTLVSDKNKAVEFVNDNEPKLFGREVWSFATHLYSYIKTYKNTPTLKGLLEKLPKNSNQALIDSTTAVWNAIDSFEYDNKNYPIDLEKLKKRFAVAQLSKLKDDFAKIDLSAVDIDKQISSLQKTAQDVKSLNKIKSYEKKTLKESVDYFKEQYVAKQEDPTYESGIKTHYSYLDHVTGGLRPGELILVGAESGGGKSLFLMNLAIQMWMQENTIYDATFKPGVDILYFSLEMPFGPCRDRVYGRLSQIPSKQIRKAKVSQEDVPRLKQTLKFMKNYPNEFEIIDMPRGATIHSIEAALEDAKLRFNPKVIVVDYLALMDYDGPEQDDWLKLGKISESLHELARVHNIIVLSAVQLNRVKPSKDSEEKIGLHRVGRSAGIMANANVGLQIESRQNENSMVDMKIHLVKNRDGELGSFNLLKNLTNGTLLDISIGEDILDSPFYNAEDISGEIERLDM
jgi:replicative DNA helicase